MIYKKNISLFFSIIIVIFCIYFSKNIKLDASSDTLILKNDETFNYYQYYNKIFPSKNFLVLAIKDNKIIDMDYINNIRNITKEIIKIESVESTFSIIDAPILLLNNLDLTDLANKEIENINNTQNDLKLILNEFSNSPIFKNQIINASQNLSSIIIYIKKKEILEQLKEEKKSTDKSDKNYKKINEK